jgi:hypothetical protein
MFKELTFYVTPNAYSFVTILFVILTLKFVFLSFIFVFKELYSYDVTNTEEM